MLASAKLLAIDNSIRCRVGWGNLNEEKISTFADNYLDNYRIPDLLTDCLSDTDVVLDPFLGSGTTCVSANNHNVNSIGIEMNDDYYGLSQKIIKEKTMHLFN